MKTFTVLALFVVLLSACQPLPENEDELATIPEPASAQYQTEIFFGLSNADGPISDSTWDNFRAATIDSLLQGYTLLDADGYWQGTREDSRVLLYVHEGDSASRATLNAVADAYKTKFQQESVLVVEAAVEYEFR